MTSPASERKMKDSKWITKGLGANFDEGCAWIRAINLTPDPEPMLFGEGPLVASGQGNVGDCGLIAAIACVSEFGGFVKDNIFVTKAGQNRGNWQNYRT